MLSADCPFNTDCPHAAYYSIELNRRGALLWGLNRGVRVADCALKIEAALVEPRVALIAVAMGNDDRG